MAYTTPPKIKDRLGNCGSDWTGPQIQPYIDRATNFIDFVTGWWFEARDVVLQINGNGVQTLLVPMPIVDISKIEIIDWPGVTSGTSEVDMDAVAIYNRHLTQPLTEPDDRQNPKIAFLGVEEGRRIIASDIWPEGKQNIRLTGKFGYTDPNWSANRTVATDAGDTITAPDSIHMTNGAFTQEDVGRTITPSGSASNDEAYVIATVVNGTDITTVEQTLTTEGSGFAAAVSAFPQWGIIPVQIEDVCARLVLRELPADPTSATGPGDGAWYERWMRASGRVRREKVRDQEIEYQPFGMGSLDGNQQGMITGDPYIDMLLMQFKRPPQMRTA